MDQVFAPWRIEWVEREEHGHEYDCVFCGLPEEATDRENRLLARGEHAYVLLNNYPYNPGHALVIPYEHTGEYRDLDEATLLGKERLVQRTMDALDEAMAPDGYNVGYNLGDTAAGGSIGDHLHAHVLPRWDGDTNFMPTISDTKVIVEAVADTYDRLHDAFAAQAGTEGVDDTSAVCIKSDTP
jgi:ATP adenylyltransferase